MAEWKVVGLISSMSTKTKDSMTPVDFDFFLE